MSALQAPLFSVVIATYNRAGLLAEALQSLWEQQFDDFEVIVVDDGSSDDTATILRSHASRLSFYQQTNQGPGAARNLGARHARGTYLAFLDSDDVWFPWTLDIYARAIQSSLQPTLLLGTPTYFSSRTELSSVRQSSLSVNQFPDYYASQDEWRWWGASAFVVRRDAFESVGGFTTHRINGEDADLAMRLGTSPGFVQIGSPSTLGYRSHAVSAMGNFDHTLHGARHLLETELAGAYPGGETRAPARRQILSRYLRSVMLTTLKQGRQRDAWRMYLTTFRWHLRLGRWRFLVGFPLMAAGRVSRG
jgi:glycosyltransferase involved in cell wall biosynthesis